MRSISILALLAAFAFVNAGAASAQQSSDKAKDAKKTKDTAPRIVVSYDVPGGEKDEKIFVQHIAGRGVIGSEGPPTLRYNPIKNGGKIELKELGAGKYQVTRYRQLDVCQAGPGRMHIGVFVDRRQFELKVGETKRIDFVRKQGQVLNGRVLGLEAAGLDRAAVMVCSKNLKDPGSRTNLDVVTYDATLCNDKGEFKTELLPPGDYVLLVQGYVPPTQEELFRTGRRGPRFVARKPFTIAKDEKPELLQVKLEDTLAVKHRVIMQGKKKLAVIDENGGVEWEIPWGGIHDIHVLDSGNVMVQQGRATVAEIDLKTKKVVWSYDAAKHNGNQGKRIEVHAFQPLGGGKVMIAESGSARIIEIDRTGKLLREVKLKVDNPHPHHDTRLARKLANGNYLVAHEQDGVVREYSGKSGDVVWEYKVPLFGKSRKPGHGPEAFGNQVFAAVRLKNGNTLIATGNGHSVLEVTPQKKVVWALRQNDLPNITLAWVTTLEVLPNGNYVIGNCHAGPNNPLLVEIEPKTKRVVWTFDRFDTFGNSAPNSLLLDARGETIR